MWPAHSSGPSPPHRLDPSGDALDDHLGHWLIDVPPVYLGHEVCSPNDPFVMVDHAAFGEGWIARTGARFAGAHPDQCLARRDDVGEVLRVDLGSGVVAGRQRGDLIAHVRRQLDRVEYGEAVVRT